MARSPDRIALDEAAVDQRDEGAAIDRFFRFDAGKGAEAGAIDAAGEAKAGQQQLLPAFADIERLPLGQSVAARLDRRQPLLRGARRPRSDDAVAVAADPAVRARADADVLASLPDGEVVPAFAGRPGMVGNLVGGKASRLRVPPE